MGREYCPKSDLPVEACAHCKGFSTPRTRPLSPRGELHVGGFSARFSGDCAACPDAISPEDQITQYDGGYAHVRCV